jgi:septal ring factor EnvC (AmiA/AmiB activator)
VTPTLPLLGLVAIIFAIFAIVLVSSVAGRAVNRSLAALKSVNEILEVALDNLRHYNRHDERVAELLGASNAYLERARSAERDYDELDKMTSTIETENEGLAQRLADQETRIIELEGELRESHQKITALETDNTALLENQVLTEQELTATKKALQDEEDSANDWAARYHRDIGKPAEAVAH